MSDSPDARLWQAVLGAALADTAKGKDTGYLKSRDFAFVCTAAGFDSEAVRDRFDPDAYQRAIRAA